MKKLICIFLLLPVLSAAQTEPYKSYEQLAKEYSSRKLDPALLPLLVRGALAAKDKAVLKSAGTEYVRYLQSQGASAMFDEENIKALMGITNSSKDEAFSIFYWNASAIDLAMKSVGYAQGVIDPIIIKEEIAPVLPDLSANPTEETWKTLHASISKKYGDQYADRILAWHQHRWYAALDDNDQLRSDVDLRKSCESAYYVLRNYGNDLNSQAANVPAMAIFNDCQELSQMEVAIECMKNVMWREPGVWPAIRDTYAILLYKAGQVTAAIEQEQIAARSAAQAAHTNEAKYYEECIAKMKKGEPAWSRRPLVVATC